LRRLVDTHAHLSDQEGMEGVITRARQAGVESIIAVGANLETSRATLGLADSYRGYVYPALGIHPTEWADNHLPTTLQYMEEHVDDCVAVGEIGLDYWHRDARKNSEIREEQRRIYAEQLKISSEHGKPASVHGRGSWKDAIDLASEHGPDRIVFHWYSGTLDLLRELLDQGYYISATPAAEYSRDHRAALKEAPIERILAETDSPVFMRNRGRNSEPADLSITVKALAKLKDASEEEVAGATTRNAERFFRIRV
jgi:TatD DNase family protein